MKVGELFVGLGVKGSEKTLGAIGSVTKGLGEAKTMSLEAKAGILAMLYAVEQLVSKSGQAGTNLKNFSALTGISAQTLQQWQYAARQAGASNEEMASSFKNIQDRMTDMIKFNKGAPETIGLVNRTVGFDIKEAQNAKTGPVYVMKKLQEFAKKAKDHPDIVRKVFRDFGVSEGVTAGAERGVFNEENFKKAPKYSEKDINQLDKANRAWANLGNEVEMAIGKLNSKHGLQLVKDIDKITTSLLKLADTLITVGEKFKVFDAVSETFKGINALMELMNGKSVEDVSKDMSKGKKRQFGQGTWWMNALDSVQNAVLAPGNLSHQSSTAGGKTHDVNIEQNFNFQHDGMDHHKVGEAARKGAHQGAQHGVKHSFKQTPQGQTS